MGHPDDAAVYRLDADRVLIATTDFFTPIVDDAYDYGAIAAVNALSDIYAMGGEPAIALNIIAWPSKVSTDLLTEVVRGCAEVVKEAGAVIAGGHSISDDEPKIGLAVIGFAHPDHLMLKGGAKAGDRLYLTKPLGSGTITTALKRQMVPPIVLEEAVMWMKQLNRTAASVSREIGVKAATDITGFGFIGHALEMAQESSFTFIISTSEIPFMTGAQRLAEEWVFPGGSVNNRKTCEPFVEISPRISESDAMLLFDAQTSGGLLLAIPEVKCPEFEAVMRSEGAPFWMVGQVVDRQQKAVIIET